MKVLVILFSSFFFCFAIDGIEKDQTNEKQLEDKSHSTNEFPKEDLTGKSPEEVVFYLCRRSVVDACTCHEVQEEQVYERLSKFVTDQSLLGDLGNIIDDFQEVNINLVPIFNFTASKCLWDALIQMGVSEDTALKIMSGTQNISFNKQDVESALFKVVRKLGCGVHWKDMAKYRYIKEVITGIKEDFVPPEYNKKHYDTYIKIIKTVIERQLDESAIDKTKKEFIRELYKNGVKKEQVEKVFKNVN